MYDISVIIPTYNRANMVCDCVDSVLAQKGVAFDVVIISKSLFAWLYDTSGIETMKIMCYNAMK